MCECEPCFVPIDWLRHEESADVSANNGSSVCWLCVVEEYTFFLNLYAFVLKLLPDGLLRPG